MNKFKSFMEKFKKNMFMYLVVWLAMVILLVAPITYTITEARLENKTWVEGIISNLVENLLEFPITKVFETEEEAMMFSKGYECQRDKNKVILMNNNIKHIIKDLSQYEIIDISSSVQSLEELFLHYYGGQHD